MITVSAPVTLLEVRFLKPVATETVYASAHVLNQGKEAMALNESSFL